jgi:hypothetical protein
VLTLAAALVALAAAFALLGRPRRPRAAGRPALFAQIDFRKDPS